jgi:hypothetical protein
MKGLEYMTEREFIQKRSLYDSSHSEICRYMIAFDIYDRLEMKSYRVYSIYMI